MTEQDVQVIIRRLDRIEALTNERLDRFEARLQRLEQRDDFRDEAFTEVLERLARIEATLQSGAAVVKFLVPVMLTLAGLAVSVLFWLIQRMG
ncbi:MAG: hypothetical protein RMJ05_10110 [Thermomicrobium sp.]|nr:hypothetical protein [Thermomicrobium sp.]MDW8007061.1 hypothetical protein [Thermomicrobium sp.]